MKLQKTIPLAILGGSDLKHGRAPTGSGQHTLAAYKGVELSVDGRPLVGALIERFRASAAFGPISIGGPHRLFGGLDSDVQVIDTDADVATNVRAVIDAFLARHPTGPLAIVTCDVLPTAEELAHLARRFHEGPACDVWFPLVHAPEDRLELGPFGWKPEYRVVPSAGAAAIDVLPGHLMILDPRALRLELVYRLLGAAYRTRNLPVSARRRAMLGSTLRGLLYQDLLHLLSLRIPDLTWTVVRHGSRLARALRSGNLALAALEQQLSRIVIAARQQRRHPERGVRLPIVDALTLAEDVDTDEEARALGVHFEPSPRPRN